MEGGPAGGGQQEEEEVDRKMTCQHIAGAAPKRGTSVGAERSLSVSKPGGTCLIPFLSRAANSLPLRQVLRTPAHFFSSLP